MYTNLLSIFLVILTLTACNNESNQEVNNSTPPEAGQTSIQEEKAQTPKDILNIFANQRALIIKERNEGLISEYAVRDGNGSMVAESTTFYKDTEKTMPCKTKIIFLTGDFADVYWLSDQTIWIDQDEYTYIFQKGNFIMALRDGEETELRENELKEIAKLPKVALEIVTSPLPNN